MARIDSGNSRNAANAPPRSEHRLAALRFCFTILGWTVVFFGWACLLSFTSADPPSTSVWPQNDPPHNLCRVWGAYLAYYAFYYVGCGVYPLWGVLTLYVLGWAHGVRFGDKFLRLIGLSLITASAASASAMFVPASDQYLLTGPGGVLGAIVAEYMVAKLATLGSIIVLMSAFGVGMILAADEIVLHLVRGARWAGKNSGPMISAGSRMVAAAGAVLADGVTRVTEKLASAGDAETVPPSGAAGGPRGGKPRQLLLPRGDNPEFEELESKKLPSAKAARKPLPARIDDDDDDIDDLGDSDATATPPKLLAPKAPAAIRTSAAEHSGNSTKPDAGAAAATSATGKPAASSGGADAAAARAATPSGGARASARPPADIDDLDDDEPNAFDAPGAIAASMAADGIPAASNAALTVRPMTAKPARPGSIGAAMPTPADDKYELPGLDLLDEMVPIDRESIEGACREKAFVLEQTLNEFKLEVQVVAIDTGPVITVFELKIAPGIKVSQIVSLSNDLARALRAPAVRVVAPLPGKNTIGIEVPNVDKEKVKLRELMLAVPPRTEGYSIPLYLGKDASGAPLVGDLTKMPHLLVAGTTGSGKSVCISSIVMSILLARTPSEVQLILVDPKVVELSVFKDVPHLMCPIVTEMSKAEAILDWAATKMDERYALLAEVGCKDIRGYNKLGYDGLKERLNATDEEMAKIPVKLPFMVIIIDELADLMMTSAKEVEFYLCRIAQKSRAVGIHLIVSTQRPQANVVTGLIKSNLPSRIAFRVSSRLDSRIVLDQNGGEVLMGQGDMLYLPPGSAKLVRAQGTFIGDDELRRIVKHARSFGEPTYHPELVRMPDPNAANATERDELFDEAVDIILESGRGSVSLLQRRLTIGYGRASRLVDQMYAAGIVGDYKGSQAREVIISKDDWAAVRNQRDREEAAESEDI